MLEAYFDEDLYEYSDFPFNFGIVELDSTPSPSQLRGVVEGSLREVPEGGGGNNFSHFFTKFLCTHIVCFLTEKALPFLGRLPSISLFVPLRKR